MLNRAALCLLSVLFSGTAFCQEEIADIPLYIFNSSTKTGGVEYKVGISLNLGTSGSYNGYHLYEFDTGGTGFYAGSAGTDVWGNNPTISSVISETYASQNLYTANAVTTNVIFEPSSNPGSTGTIAASNVTVGLIVSATNPTKLPTDPINNWNTNIASGTSPLDTYFYGDFGMSTASSNGLEAIVPQLPGNLNTGFVINLGSYPGAATSQGPLGQGDLQIGLTAADRDKSKWAQIIYLPQSSGTYDYSGQNMYPEVIGSGTLTITGPTTAGVESSTSVTSGIVFDTGAPDTNIHTGSTGAGYAEIGPFVETGTSGQLLPGEDVTLTGSDTIDGTALSIYSTGSNDGMNIVNTSTTDALGYDALYTNTGIDAFWGNEVMFDLADGWIGIRPVPEPSVPALVLLGIAGAAFFKLRKSRSSRVTVAAADRPD